MPKGEHRDAAAELERIKTPPAAGEPDPAGSDAERAGSDRIGQPVRRKADAHDHLRHSSVRVNGQAALTRVAFASVENRGPI